MNFELFYGTIFMLKVQLNSNQPAAQWQMSM